MKHALISVQNNFAEILLLNDQIILLSFSMLINFTRIVPAVPNIACCRTRVFLQPQKSYSNVNQVSHFSAT
jgi:hypothetical protein